jgi:hypothetical protein
MDTCGGKMKDLSYLLNTGEISKILGITITSKFIVEKLKIEPLHFTKTGYLWEDIDEVRVKLAKYLINSVGKK